MASSAATVPLDPSDVDDLIYLSRTGDLDELKSTLAELSQKHHAATTGSIIQSAIDIDGEGLGSQSCLLHYPSANGNAAIVAYLLEQVSTSEQNGVDGTTTTTRVERNNTTSKGFVNHKNVSGNTPLHWAAMNGHLDVVKVLVKAGADPTVVNGAGRDAVVEAEWSSKDGSDDCVNWMLQECPGLMRGVSGDGAREAEGDAEETNGTDAKNEVEG